MASQQLTRHTGLSAMSNVGMPWGLVADLDQDGYPGPIMLHSL